jgi:hypothetical protein
MIHWTKQAESPRILSEGRQLPKIQGHHHSEASPIKAVILDYGEVICFPPRAREFALMAAVLGVVADLFRSIYPADRAPYDRGDLTPTAYWRQFQVLSCEVRLVKPDRAIYKHCLNGLNVRPSETLFVDDNEVNVKAARALGITSIRFRSTTQLRDELAGLPIPRSVSNLSPAG